MYAFFGIGDGREGTSVAMSGSAPSSLPGFHPEMPAVTSVEESVTDALRNGILQGDLPPGQRLLQEQLAERFGVSRIPLRDALRRLEVEGLVRIDPRKGAYVAILTVVDVEEIYELREMLEAPCMRYAVRSLDDKTAALIVAMSEAMDTPAPTPEQGRARRRAFYATLYGYSGKPRMVELILRLRDDVYRYHVLKHVTESKHAHDELRDCIRRRDGDAAAKLIAKHLRGAGHDLIEVLTQEEAERTK